MQNFVVEDLVKALGRQPPLFTAPLFHAYIPMAGILHICMLNKLALKKLNFLYLRITLYFALFSSPPDFPQSGKLILFIGNMWSEIFTSKGVISKAIKLVARKRSNGHVLKCLKTVLKPEEVRGV